MHRIRPAVVMLAQAVSQRLEHADLDDALRLELTLRLAELEALLHDQTSSAEE